jgi:ribonuclease E
MLINATNREEVRMAIVVDSTLEDYQIERTQAELSRGNIYRGVIVNLQPALDAAFVDYGAMRNGFLPIQDVVPEARYREPPPGVRPRIDNVLEAGRPIVVQVVRDSEGSKGAALTTNLSLAGRYLVLTPFDPTRGVSRKVEDEESRARLKAIVDRLELPPGAGAIVRTAALDQSRAELQRDLAVLLRLWKRIRERAREGSGPQLLYSDQDPILRLLRDHLSPDVEEIVIDDELAAQRVEHFLETFQPRGRIRFLRYQDRVPLFTRFGLESQIDRIFAKSVPLPSGGSIVIESTEALTAIDVNSGRGGQNGSHEEMALATNLEAAAEVARQLRLRDLGGLIVVDFIDLKTPRARKALEKAMREALRADRARTSVGRISPNGLLEINRQRVRQALEQRTHRPCPTCNGTGHVPTVEALGLNLVRRIEARAASGRLLKVRVELLPELADAIQNTRRADFARIEQQYGVTIEIVSSPRLLGPEEQLEWCDRPAGALPRSGEGGSEGSVPREPVAAAVAPAVQSFDRRSSGEVATVALERGPSRRRTGRGRFRRRKEGNGWNAGSKEAKPAELVELPVP